MPTPARHETRALLRAHLSAASSFGHLTRHCPVCHRLLRLAMDSTPRTVEYVEYVEPSSRTAEPSRPAESTERSPERVEGEGAPTA
ncbi:DUF6274 family protein [Streptomyces hirsutus]|uniref:DUF6274 family protein n=1 Tax=Streptomyces hirsutus TaxID=35620 RepID=UPI00365C5303